MLSADAITSVTGSDPGPRPAFATSLAMSGEPVDFLRQKSGVYKSRLTADAVTDVMIIDDASLDAQAIGALLRSAFGRDVEVRHASSLMRARNMLLERMPELIVLDDFLPPKDRADTSIPLLRQAGFAGRVIVVSGAMTRLRRLSLLQAGANGVVHKDDLNAASLVEAASRRCDDSGDKNPADKASKPVGASGDDTL